jgi:hypothetical protein
MSLIDQLAEYVNGIEVKDVNALNDLGRIKVSLTQLLVELSKENGSFKTLQLQLQNTNKLTGGTTNTVNKTRNGNRRNMNVTAKNKNQGISEEKKFRISVLLSVMVLCALAHLRGITPFIHSFTQLSILNKKDMSNKGILPFMSMMENTFPFFKTSLLSNIKEGLYAKENDIINGMEFLIDPKKSIITLTNIAKVQVYMVGLLAPALGKEYKPSVRVIERGELGPIFEDILKVINERVKPNNLVHMKVPDGAYLVVADFTQVKG